MEKAPAPKFITLQIIHAALTIGSAMFLALAFFVNNNPLVWMPDAGTNSIMLYIGIALAAFGIVLGTVLYNSLLSKIDTSLPLSQKLPKYTSALIVRYALLEGTALFNTAVFLITGTLINIALSALLILILIAIRPQRQQVADVLKVQYPDILD